MILSTDIEKIYRTLAITGCQTLRSMVSPCLQQYGITFFNYHKEYFDGSILILNTNEAWAAHYFKKGYINKPEYIPAIYKNLNYFLWLTKDYPELLIDAATHFDIANGITIILPCEDGIEFCGFGAPLHNVSMLNFYINNLDLLYQFCLSFKDQASHLLENAEKNKIIVPDKTGFPSEIQLSARQKLCGHLLLEGKTAKEIGKKLGLSHRTIEFYIDQIKHKLDCSNKAELIIKLKYHLFL